MRLLKIPLLFIGTLLLWSCGSLQDDGRLSQGEIEFEVTYPKMKEDNFMVDFMPDVMTMRFEKERYISELSAGAGMFRSSFIADAENKEFTQMVKLINKKMYVTLDEKEVGEMLKEMPKYTITKAKGTKEIAGYKCHKVIVKTSDDEEFSAFYTKDINIDNPNWCTQYKDVPGVLLEYQLEKYGICMRLKASNVAPAEIAEDEFNYEEDYKLVSRQRIDTELQEIFDSFNQ